MNKVIYKYPLQHPWTKLDIRKEAGTPDPVIKHIGRDDKDQVCAWVEIVPGDYPAILQVHVFATGQKIPFDLNYVGTVEDPIWHFYV